MKFFTKRRTIWTVVLVGIAVIIFLVWRGKNNNPGAGIQTDAVKRQDIKQTVLTTGQVTSDVDLSLSFQSGGIVKKIYIKEGDKVKSGQTLAVLDQSALNAALLSARGSLAQAEANYQKVLSGASNEQIAVAQKAVDAAKQALVDAQNNYNSVKGQQQTNVNNAFRTMLNGGLQAIQVVGPYSSPGVTSASAPVVSGVYRGTAEGVYTITQSGNSFSVSGLETQSPRQLDTRSTYALGTSGLYVQFPTDQVSATWQVSIPNDKSSMYVTNLNAYQTAQAAQASALSTAQAQIDSAQNSLNSAEANLALQQASARPADISAAKASIVSAQGQVAAAQANLSNTILKAPNNGTITKIDVKVGEQAVPSKEVMILQDIGNLYAEANVSEANIASLKVGQPVDYTFDALGPDRHFSGTISTINPASTLVSGVVNYKVTAGFNAVTDIKPGMTANMTILVASKNGVLAVPSSAIISHDNKKFVRVIDDPVKKTFHEVEVQTGLEADGGLVEITSGLNEGQQIVVFMK